jgi:hypothetical protein
MREVVYLEPDLFGDLVVDAYYQLAHVLGRVDGLARFTRQCYIVGRQFHFSLKNRLQ